MPVMQRPHSEDDTAWTVGRVKPSAQVSAGVQQYRHSVPKSLRWRAAVALARARYVVAVEVGSDDASIASTCA